METIQQSKEQTLTSKEFHQLFDDVHEETWELRSQDEYFTRYEQLSAKHPEISKDELEAFITKKSAGEYATTRGFDETKKAAFMLFAAAPHYAIHQAQKNLYGPNDKNLTVVSGFNDLVRNFTILHQEVDKDMLSARLVESVAGSGIDNEFVDDAELRESMDATIAGARTEVGLEQLFTYTGIPFKRGNTAQDLNHIDYIVPAGRDTLDLDVKSSVKGTGSDSAPYTRIGPLHYRLLRLFGPGDFKGNSFKLREESLENKAPATSALIDKLIKIG